MLKIESKNFTIKQSYLMLEPEPCSEISNCIKDAKTILKQNPHLMSIMLTFNDVPLIITSSDENDTSTIETYYKNLNSNTQYH